MKVRPLSVLFCCVTYLDYDVTDKAAVILRALQVCCSSSRGRAFDGFMTFVLGNRVSKLKKKKKNYTDSENWGLNMK